MTVTEQVGETWLAMPRETFLMLVSNLLSNACKYTKAGDSISLQATIANGLFSLTVEDSGSGIPAGEEKYIFDWFTRGGSGTGIEGWGIGLAFVREAAEAAGGAIQLQTSENTTGAHFFLTLPLGEQSLSEKASEKPRDQVEQFQGSFPGQEKSYTIVLVEDDPDLLTLLPTLFPPHWTCLTTSTAEQGWILAVEKMPDLVVTDLMLPGESGFDLTRRLKEDDRTAHIPVIILTALGNEEQRLTGLGLSADSFMGKPFSNEELLLRVQGLIANRERVFERVKHLVVGLQDESHGKQTQDQVVEDAFLQKLHAAFPTDSELLAASLDGAAAKLAMSKRSVQREMQRIGISWREYKRLRRLRIAMDLLRDPKNRVASVAEQAGYSSAAHFSKIFKQHTGVSPTEWRREQHSE